MTFIIRNEKIIWHFFFFFDCVIYYLLDMNSVVTVHVLLLSKNVDLFLVIKWKLPWREPIHFCKYQNNKIKRLKRAKIIFRVKNNRRKKKQWKCLRWQPQFVVYVILLNNLRKKNIFFFFGKIKTNANATDIIVIQLVFGVYYMFKLWWCQRR